MREPTGHVSGEASPGPRVLVVDDEQDMREMLKSALELSGFRVRLCADPLQAEEAAAEFAPDAFILDLTMPGLTGIELCERLRSGKRFASAVIIMMTGKVPGTDRGEAVAHGLAVGADDYLLKPFGVDEFVARLRARLEARREREHATARAHSAEREQRVASDRAEHYLHAAGIMLLALDANGRVTMINRKGLDVLGYGEDEVVGQNWLDTFVPERLRETIRTIFDQIVAGEVQPAEYYENPVITDDGEERLIAWHNSLLRDEQGRINGTLSSGEDITDRKRAEDLLRAQRNLGLALSTARSMEEVLRLCTHAAFKASGMDCGGVYLVDEKSGSLDLAFHEGLSPSFVERAAHFDADAPQARLVMEGQPAYTQYQALEMSVEPATRQEDLRAIAIIPILHEEQVIACLNVSSHKHDQVPDHARTALETIAGQIGSAVAHARAENALAESEGRYRRLFEQSGDAIFIHDREGRLLDVNSEACRMLNRSREDLIGGRMSEGEAHMEEDKKMAREAFATLLQTGHVRFESRLLTSDNRVLDVEINASLVDADKGIAQGIVRDITLRKRAEAEQRERAEHLEAEAGRARRYAEIVGQQTDPQTALIGEGPAHKDILGFVASAARAPSSVLVLGESGTGKEVVSRSIHAVSPRAGRPFVVVDCAALKGELLESELFGHEKGAFTGATQRKAGLVEVADGGTLFVDEIGEMPLALQSKLLRVLERGEYRRLGSVQPRKSDLRVVAATNRELASEVERGLFRRDLYYRLNVLSITLPPLRERREDIPLLAMHFLRHSRVTMSGEKKLQPKALRKLQAYRWPGNIRELANVLERAVILSGSGGEIKAEHLPSEIRKAGETSVITSKVMSLADAEKQAVMAALAASKGNKTRAAEVLGVSRLTIRKKIEKYGLST
jgi:PAS domain S-box-containing protein